VPDFTKRFEDKWTEPIIINKNDDAIVRAPPWDPLRTPAFTAGRLSTAPTSASAGRRARLLLMSPRARMDARARAICQPRGAQRADGDGAVEGETAGVEGDAVPTGGPAVDDVGCGAGGIAPDPAGVGTSAGPDPEPAPTWGMGRGPVASGAGGVGTGDGPCTKLIGGAVPPELGMGMARSAEPAVLAGCGTFAGAVAAAI
jgi:hypothetical protein